MSTTALPEKKTVPWTNCASATPDLSAEDMIRLIDHAPPGPWPSGWASWPNVNEAQRIMARRFAEHLTPGRHTYPEERGIVIAGGGLKYFPSAWVCINLVRHFGCTLPIQLWYLGDGECDPYMRRLLKPLGVECVDARKLEKDVPCRILCGWELKPYATLHAPFAQVLFLDADNGPVRNVRYLFDTPLEIVADREAVADRGQLRPGVAVPGHRVRHAVPRSRLGPAHRCQDKWRLGGNRRNNSLANEDLCFRLVAELRKRWGGVLWHNPDPTPVEQQVIAALTGRRFLYRRVSHDERPMRLEPLERIGEGSTECERPDGPADLSPATQRRRRLAGPTAGTRTHAQRAHSAGGLTTPPSGQAPAGVHECVAIRPGTDVKEWAGCFFWQYVQRTVARETQSVNLLRISLDRHKPVGVVVKVKPGNSWSFLALPLQSRGFVMIVTELLVTGYRHQQAGALEQAEQLYRQVLQVEPNQFDALHLLALVCWQTKRPEQALAYLQEALAMKPDCAQARYNLGNILNSQGKKAQAEQSYRQALHFDPLCAEAHFNLGNALRDLGRLDEAVASYRNALQVRPQYARALVNLGSAYLAQGKLAEAEASLREASRLQPTLASAHTNLGDVLRQLGRTDEALACHQEGLRIDPLNVEAHNNLGTALSDQGRIAEALACFDWALQIDPDYVLAHLNRGLTWLLRGDFQRGWEEYEWRLRASGARTFPRPCWDGSSLDGKAILLWCEQGLGDALQFIRYAPLVKERGGRVIVQCPAGLIPLLSRCSGIDQLAAPSGSLPDFDLQAPLLSLAGIFDTSLESVPAKVPYLSADPGLRESWKMRLDKITGIKVGIAWQGNPRHPRDRQRSAPLQHFAPLAAVRGVQLVGLQKGPGCDQLGAVADRFFVIGLGQQLDEAAGTFMDTAAVMSNLDLVITTDTAIAHLAGALGVPVWVALPFVPDWRWLLERADSPWYPTMRLFRQEMPGDWDGVFARMAEALRSEFAGRNPGVSVPLSVGELLDKITILEIKTRRLSDPVKLQHINRELTALQAAREHVIPPDAELDGLVTELRQVNERLWQIEDELRLCEQQQDFGARFIELARLVYRENDHRYALKRRINGLLSSPWIEVKSYSLEQDH